MEPFRDVAEALQKEFSEDDEVQGVIAREQSLCEQWALENVVEDQSPEPRALTLGKQEPQHAGARGVFDDVDASRRRARRVFPGPTSTSARSACIPVGIKSGPCGGAATGGIPK